MTIQADPTELIGARVAGTDGEDVGAIEQVYQDDRSGMATWVRVRTGLFGNKDRFVPLAGGRRSERGIEVPFSKQQIKDGPDIDVDRQLSAEQVKELSRHYGLSETGVKPDRGQTGGEVPGQAGSGEAWVTRAEERAHVTTESHESGRVKVHKHVDVEPVEQQVRVFHEEAVIEREPITDPAQVQGSRIAEDEQEIILHEERPVISKETVPVERIRVRTERREEDQTVRTEIRKERVEVERENGDTRGRRPS